MHKLLERQLKRFFDPAVPIPESLKSFLAAVNEAYTEADKERLLLERSLELTSQELSENNQLLQEELSQKKASFATLQQAQSDLRQMIEQSPFGVVVRRGESWIFVNQAWARFLGYDDPSELIGKSGRDFVPREDIERYRSGMIPLDADGVPIGEVRLRRRDGELIVFDCSPAQTIFFEGQPAHLIFVQDNTEKKRLEARLLLADRLASLGTLAAGIAHEINNPLAYILLNCELALDQLDQQQETKILLEEILEGAQRVKQIVRDLSVFSRPDEETRAAIDPISVLESACSIAYNEIRHKAALIKEFGPTPPVWANSARLGQVFINLLVNAAQAIPTGSRSQHQIYLRSFTNDQGQAVIEVRDSGGGIPKEILLKIFAPFFTTKPIGVGNGLGLSICHSIIASLGGQIEAENAPDQGAIFRVILPASPNTKAPQQAPEGLQLPRPARILLIDDEVSIGVSLRRELSNYQISICLNAQDALLLLRRDAAFDVILCDVMMPSMTGIELYSILQRELPALCSRVIFLKGGVLPPEAAAFIQSTPNQHIEKPLALTALYEAMTHVLSSLVL